MREAWRAELYLQRAELFLIGPLHLPGLVLHSIKEVAEAGGLQILPGALGTGSQKLGGACCLGVACLSSFSPCLQKNVSRQGDLCLLSVGKLLGGVRGGEAEGENKQWLSG